MTSHLIRALLLAVMSGSLGCGVWVRSTHPPRVDLDTHLAAERAPDSGVEIFVDPNGIPTLYAEDEAALVYGLGFMHGRDRAFQIQVLRAAALGRLTEIFGEPALDADRQLRMLSYRLEEAEAAIPLKDRAFIQRYLDGLDAGASHAGRSAEMRLTGTRWQRLEVRDLVAMVRLQGWNLSMDLDAELVRARLLARLPPSDPRLKALLTDVPASGHAILDQARKVSQAPPPESRARSFLTQLGLARGGSSNAWAIHGSRTKSGKPILCNDPHLAHRTPGVFYLARLVTHDGRVDVTGATFPGLPAVVIGHNTSVAWSMTTSFADTQDLVRIQLDPDDPRRYLLDGANLPMTVRDERFTKDKKQLGSELYLETEFGPVLPSAFAQLMEPGETYSLLWTGFDPELGADTFSAFWNLARAKTLAEARASLDVAVPSQSMLLATTEGEIGFHLLGAVPLRSRAERMDLPRDGRSIAAGWEGALHEDEKPSLSNPPGGILITANQRIATDERTRARIGGYGWTAHRAERIAARLKRSLKSGKVNRESLLAIQLDSESLEAQRLAPIFGRRCPTSLRGHDPELVRSFCQSLTEFDGTYTTEVSALPFVRLLRSLQLLIVGLHVGSDVANQVVAQPFVIQAIEDAIIAEDGGARSPLFDDLRTPNHDGLDLFMERAASRALDALEREGKTTPGSWRWGANHHLTFRSPLAAAPLVGGEFVAPTIELQGDSRAPRAESGTPVGSGAVMRMAVEMSDPPKAGFILDFGQSGHAGAENWGDQTERWSRGELIDLGGDRRAIEARAKFSITLGPQTAIEE